jgi:hypothetical protein
MAQLIGIKQISDPEIVGMGEVERVERYKTLADMYRQAGVRPPEYDGWRKWISEADPDPVKRLPSVLQFMAEAQGREPMESDIDLAVKELAALNREVKEGAEADFKAGRILSKTNEAKIRRMQELANELLAALDKDKTDEQEDED